MLAAGLCSQPAAWHKWVRALRLTTDNVMATATDGGGPRLAMEPPAVGGVAGDGASGWNPQAGILTLRITD